MCTVKQFICVIRRNPVILTQHPCVFLCDLLCILYSHNPCGPTTLEYRLTMPEATRELSVSGHPFYSRPGVCHIFVHEPIETAHLTIDDIDMLRDKVRDIIEKKLAEQ